VRQIIFAERANFEVLQKRPHGASPSLKPSVGHWKSPSLETDHRTTDVLSVILTTIEIKLCSELLVALVDDFPQALQICRHVFLQRNRQPSLERGCNEGSAATQKLFAKDA